MTNQNFSNNNYDVFISYRHVNKDMVKSLVEELKRCNIRYFIDWKDIDYGEKYSAIIAKAISCCKTLLLFWTKDVEGSDDIESEVALAKKRKMTIIPYKIGNFDADEQYSLSYALGTLSWYEVQEQTPETIANVVKRIQRALAVISRSNASPSKPVSPVQPSVGSMNNKDMPPLPEELVRLQFENSAMLDAITKVKSFKHASLGQENDAVEQAQKQYDEYKKRKDSLWQNMP